MDSYRYSEHPIQRYALDLGDHACEVSTIITMGDVECVPYWNFFWLSNPTIDGVPGAGRDWWRVYAPTTDLLSSVISDVADDYTLHHALSLHPSGFAEWWETQRHQDFRTYSVAKGRAWVDSVSRRAEQAAERTLRQFPPVVRSGNVLVLADYRARA